MNNVKNETLTSTNLENELNQAKFQSPVSEIWKNHLCNFNENERAIIARLEEHPRAKRIISALDAPTP
jgi:hypothetical protein